MKTQSKIFWTLRLGVLTVYCICGSIKRQLSVPSHTKSSKIATAAVVAV